MKEKALLLRRGSGYYMSKIKHAALHEEMSKLYDKYITKEMLVMLNNKHTTQTNEAMNNSVCAYAPKGRTYSSTTSLDCRVAIAGCVQIMGYKSLWKRLFPFFNLPLDATFAKELTKRDKRKADQSARMKRNEYKAK